MALTFNATLASQIAAAATKLDSSNVIKTAFGNTRRLILSKDGVPFLNVGMSGDITLTSGNITGFGSATGTTVRAAANLLTGTCTLRLEGNGNWMEASLGLSKAAQVAAGVLQENVVTYDYYLPANPTTTSGIGFASAARLKAPRFKSSGTGPVAPADPVYTLEFENWSTGSAVLAGTVALSERMDNFVYDDPEMASSQGDIRVHRVPSSVVMGEIEFGALLWSVNGSVNAESSNAVDEILVISKPVNSNWPGYPRYSGHIPGTSNTYAPPFKIRIKKNGVLVKVHEMRDGLPINDPSLNQMAFQDGTINTLPWRPHFNCGQVLPYRSARHKLHTYAYKYYPGQEPEILRPTTMRQKVSSNPTLPAFWIAQVDGINHFHAQPKWAVPAGVAAQAADTINDPYLYQVNSETANYGSQGYGSARLTGWGYEPGANGGHDWLTGPGGARQDRAAMPGKIAAYMTNANYVRPRNNDPILDMVEAWNANYCNIPWHLVTDVTTGATLPFDEVSEGLWAQGGGTYYGSVDTMVPGGRAYSVNFFCTARSAGETLDYAKPFFGQPVDKNGRMPFHGVATDYHHAYRSAAPVAFLFNSPMAAYLAKHAYINSILAQLSESRADAHPSQFFLVRKHAWRFKPYVEAWKLSSDHPLGMPRNLIEQRWQIELEKLHDTIYTDVMLLNAQDPYSRAVRNLGVPLSAEGGSWGQASQSLMYYMAGVLQLMKSTGSWAAMRAKSAKCSLALDFLIRCLDLYAIEWAIDTNGKTDWYDDSIFLGDANRASTNNNVTIASSWAAVAAYSPAAPGEDWIHDANGNFVREKFDGSQHLRYQYLCMRRDWITEAEVPCGSTKYTVAQGIAKYKTWYDFVTANVQAKLTANASGFDCRAADWTYRQPSYGVIKPPVTV